MTSNRLYYGDNLDVLRRFIPDESVDLIYLDPPFNSNRSYNVLFREADGSAADSQMVAFDDTWSWGPTAEAALHEIATTAPPHVVEMIQAIVGFVGRNDVTAYLVMMTIRLIELHRVLRPTGSIYLHCDPTASHYLKVVMDTIFGARSFRNEVIWQRTKGRKSVGQYGRVHDVILYYTASDSRTWNMPTVPQSPETARGHDILKDESGLLYRLSDLTGAGSGPARTFGDRVILPPPGRHWMYDQAGIDRLLASGRIVFNKRGVPRLKNMLTDMPGVSVTDVWSDIDAINSAAAERLGYPTQKPVALLERIINASSSPGDMVLDPFCGCGTSITAAQKLDRHWIGIDITHLAVSLMRARLLDTFGEKLDYEVIGVPVDAASARALALQDRFEFEHWALGIIGARSANQQKKGADQGVDGVLFFIDDLKQKAKKVVIQVKSGHVQSSYIRDLARVTERENAVMGFLITLDPPTGPMEMEALTAGYYRSSGWGRDYPKIQIRTIEQLLAGQGFDRPPTNITLAQADAAKPEAKQGRLL